MRIALAQINSQLGQFSKNREKILEFCRRAKEKRCDLVVFPELALFGYQPMDLLERPEYIHAQNHELALLAKQIPKGIVAIVGAVTMSQSKIGKPFHNSAVVLEKGRKPRAFHKELLPCYDVFDEARYFQAGSTKENVFRFKGKRILLTICEDIWGWGLRDHPSFYQHNPLQDIKAKNVDLVINLSGSPFTQKKWQQREFVVVKTAKHLKAPVVYVNMVGGQDEIVFDGGSFAVDERGRILAKSLFFDEDLNVVDLNLLTGGFREHPIEWAENLRRALVLGLRDFVNKTGMKKVHLGLSGGIDSAVVACLAVDALGPGRVAVVTLPGPFSAPASRELAEKMAAGLGLKILSFEIDSLYQQSLQTLEAGLDAAGSGLGEFGIVHENLQSRLRGMLLMAYANRENSLLLTTSNKSEYATGYSTLYGDMCGGLAPIGDLLKRDVYELALHYNREREVIPKAIITRPPSAELRPNQKDQDSLPAYDELDSAVEQIVEFAQAPASDVERWLLQSLSRTEFKRWQAPPVLKVSTRAFGRGRRMPIAVQAAPPIATAKKKNRGSKPRLKKSRSK